MAAIVSTPTGTRIAWAMLRATNGAIHNAASAVFSYGAKPWCSPWTARKAIAGASAVMS